MKAYGQIGFDFEKDAGNILKNLFDTNKVFKIEFPVDFLVIDNRKNFYLIECKASKNKRISSSCSKYQMKYATHFLIKNKKGINLLTKKEFIEKEYKNKFLMSRRLSEQEYLNRKCHKLKLLLFYLNKK